ncbi:hypothetical protein ABI_23260 [Asticcacaulis biprosthecium C19]|uniref:Translocation and assembly module TamB C-terminal domain-containing protein n=1 Tax=Asticcacaulis biprosthecium C19 TaxID=715226 RepID=F4QNK6_9CAUL|nr:translocation/assembly module TamB domain-containing protein [Asticcacaulis biprosthecium]EGF90914.1 hypothetical protein ABI_23260 [Asticcacaulis biprosthecium C19]
MDTPPEKPILRQRLDAARSHATRLSRHAANEVHGRWKALDWREVTWSKVALNIAIVLAIVTAIVAILLMSLNTAPGRRLLIEYATGIKLNSGLQIEIERIDGSLYGEMTLHNVRVKDPKGVFVQSPIIHLNWRPFGALNKHVDIREFSTPRIDVLRQPALNPSQDPEKDTGPLLPDIKIDIGKVKVEAINLAPEITGEARTLSLNGEAHLLKRRAKVVADARSTQGDLLNVLIDAVPDDNRLDIEARLSAPSGGLVDDILKLDGPVTAAIAGKGEWKLWRGKATASLGEQSLMNLDLTAQDGTFFVKGPAYPGVLLTGESAALFKPAVQVDLTAKGKDRRFDTDLKLTSDALSLTANGVVNLAGNRFDKVEAHLRLLDPDALGYGFAASDLYADLVIDGEFRQPRFDYDVKATRFNLDTLRLVDFTAKGTSRGSDGVVIIPVNARATAISGIDPRVDPLLTHLKLDGDVRIEDGQLTSDNIRLVSDRAKASGSLRGNTRDGVYTADVKASVDDYTIAEIGTMNVSTVAKMTYRDKPGFSMTGSADIVTTKWSQDGVRDLMGGNARLTGNYAWSPAGIFSFSKVSGKAPLFTLASANGNFNTKGAITLKALGTSQTYGPLDLTATGTFERPVAVLRAASPGLGVEMRDVVANITGVDGAYAIVGEGNSAYGPFSADTVLLISQGPLIIDIKTASFAGINTSGRLTQTDGGPFAGNLVLAGSGLTGTAILSNNAGDQAAIVNATGSGVVIPGDMPEKNRGTVGRAIIAANLVLRDQLELTGEVQMANATWQDFSLATGRAKINLKGEAGTIQAVATGSAAVPFHVAVNGTIAPNLYTVAAKGTANGLPFTLEKPARITKAGSAKSGAEWVLQPTKLVMEQGRMDLAGRFGEKLQMQARLHNIDLSVVNLFSNDLGVAGRAEGSVEFAQVGGRFPTARLALKIDDFSRTSAAVVSTPVDMTVDAQLNPNRSASSNYVRAVVRQGGNVVGRVNADLTPSGDARWVEALMDSGLSGGVRYNGPAAVPFSLAGLPRQNLTGAVAVAADMSGRLSQPRLNGVIKGTSLTYDNETFGTRITSLAIDGRFTNDRLELTKLEGRAGAGTVSGSGWLSLAADQRFPMSIHVDLSNARLARSDTVDSTVSGTLDVTNSQADGAWVRGDLSLPQLKYEMVRQGAAQVNVLDGVHKKGFEDKPQVADSTIPALWNLSIGVRGDRQIFVSGMGLDSEWEMDLRVIGTTRDPRVVGRMEVVRGNYTFAGKAFTIDNGNIIFDGGPLVDPEISIQASGDMQDVKGIIRVSGSAQRPSLAFSSTPALPQDEVLSRMLFGESVTNLSATEALQLASAVNGLRGGTDFLNPLGALRSATGIDRLRLVGADTETGRGTSLAAGKYLTSNVYVEIVTDTKGFTATQLEVALSRALSVLSQVGNQGTAVSVRYSKDY